MNTTSMKSTSIRGAVLLGAAVLCSDPARANVVLDWSAHLDEAVFATAEPIPSQVRSAAIVHVAIFDAVNGIERRFVPYHVQEHAAPGARADAAAVQAAYTTLVALYPGHAEALARHLADSLAAIPGGNSQSQSVARGRAWGGYVAERILELRSTDGWTDPQPPFLGGFEPGQWRSVPVGADGDGALPAVFPQLAVLTPFAMTGPDQFRPGPPYGAPIPEALRTPEYAADLEETRSVGGIDSLVRTAEQTDIARVWHAMGAIDEFRGARALIPRSFPLVDTARLFALLGMAACDALIIGWDSKFEYQLWRPHHAIRLADTDGNPSTIADPEWTALILAPRFPEYVSNHSALTAAIMRVLERELGNEHTFTLGSPLLPGVTRTYTRFSDAALEAKEARIFGGIHFRHACDVGSDAGVALGDHVVDTMLKPLPGAPRRPKSALPGRSGVDTGRILM